MNHLLKLATAAFLAAFFVSSAQAQNAGSVTNHAFAIGKGAGTTGYTSLLCTSAQLAVGQAAADPICRTITGDVTITAAGVTAIGASKVTNAQIATMAANTTKCNATAGTANPTDCTASTMRTNLNMASLYNISAVANQWISSVTNGVPSLTQPAFSNLSGNISVSQMNSGTGASSTSFWRGDGTWVTPAGGGTVTSVTCFGSAITTSGTCATAATQSDQQAASSTTAVVTPYIQSSHDSAAKAFVRFTGSTGAITGTAYNVSSVSRSGAGTYTINFTNTFANTNYGCVVTPEDAGQTVMGRANPTGKTTSAQSLFVVNLTPAAVDPTAVTVICFGRQ